MGQTVIFQTKSCGFIIVYGPSVNQQSNRCGKEYSMHLTEPTALLSLQCVSAYFYEAPTGGHLRSCC